jgi:hypothetical protein
MSGVPQATKTMACATGMHDLPLRQPTMIVLLRMGDVQAKSGFTYNGVHYVSWEHDQYERSDQAANSMDDLAATNANWVGVLVTWYQANAAASTLYADSEKTPADMAVIYAVEQFHNRGLQVILKPHVDGTDGTWRGQFNPLDPDEWFQSYNAFITHYAQLAQSQGAEGMVIGTEYSMLSGSANQARWDKVIDNVRSEFGGILTYAANATSTADEFASVSFWDKLDLIGLNGYFPLTNSDHPSVDQLVGAWTENINGNNLVETIRSFSSVHDKPVIFTEIGYRSVTGSNTQPWNYGMTGAYDPTEQANCYEAFFDVWSQFGSWMQGAFWWDWPVSGPAANDTDYNPRGKPAAEVLRTWYGAPESEA